MSTNDILPVEEIRAFAKDKGWKPSRLARAAGLGINTLRDLHDENWNPRLETLRAVSRTIREARAA